MGRLLCCGTFNQGCTDDPREAEDSKRTTMHTLFRDKRSAFRPAPRPSFADVPHVASSRPTSFYSLEQTRFPQKAKLPRWKDPEVSNAYAICHHWGAVTIIDPGSGATVSHLGPSNHGVRDKCSWQSRLRGCFHAITPFY